MKTDIDNKLRQWATTQVDGKENTARLTSSILATWQQNKDRPPSTRTLHRPLLWGVAASLAASLITALLLRPVAPANTLAALISEEQQCFNHAQNRLSQLFHEAERLFGKQLHWISMHKNTTEVGIANTPPAGTPFTLRFTLVAQTEHRGEWQRLWSTDLVVREDDYVEITPDARGEMQIKLWMHLLNQNQLFVESQLSLALSNQKQTTTSACEILSLGKVHTAAEIILNSTRYLLLQTANPVEKIPCNS